MDASRNLCYIKGIYGFSSHHHHHWSAKERLTVGHLQLARFWVVHTLSSTETCLFGPIHSWTWLEKDLCGLPRVPSGVGGVGFIQSVNVSGLTNTQQTFTWFFPIFFSHGQVWKNPSTPLEIRAPLS